jgi:alcohol-forming fatty acyl-CoA reductase
MRELKVVESYAAKSVFVTGATGFLGKVLVEKLLRCCKRVEKVYILIRSKDGEDAIRRFQDFKNLNVFERLRLEDASALEKLVPVEGDLSVSPVAGICKNSVRQLEENVNIVFHCGASVNFNEAFETSIKINLMGTRNMLDLAERFDNLEAFVHVSTAFSNTNRWKPILEEIYKTKFSYQAAIDMVERQDILELDNLNKLALKTFPNSYIFTKNQAEHLVSDRSDRFSVAIVRPSFITPSFEDPYPGWADTFDGPVGLLAFKTAGALRSFYGNGSKVIDLIPCDFAANAIIVAGTSAATCANKDLKIYNCLTSKRAPITWNKLFEAGCEAYEDFPSTNVIWFPGGRTFSYLILYLAYFLLFQLLPACFIDTYWMLRGKPTRALKLQMEIFKSMDYYKYFTHTSWEWDVTNFEVLSQLVSLDDR